MQYLIGFMSGLLGLATAFTNFSAIWILDIPQKGCESLNKSIRITMQVALSYLWLKCLSLTSVPFSISASITWTALILRWALPCGPHTCETKATTRSAHPSVPPLTSPFSSWTISTLRSVSLGSSSLKFSSFFQRRGIFPSQVYIWDFCTSQGEKKRSKQGIVAIVTF